ncbi:MAG TPA: alanine--tRNA ligase [Patescibacteria group bacterium]|nr:alanine--tRNA ligase [Patescibacteria group bacterium]
MQVPPDEFRLPFFIENGYVRKLCPHCGLHYWTLDPDSENCGDAPCVDYTFIGNTPVNRPYTMSEMREKFLSFFEERGHTRISPYPVVARWRSDLMVTIASIIDFQPYVTEGILPPPANPLVVSQPCLRFEDIDLVGITAGRHLTMFEMGGHHAFNYEGKPQIYWKNETIQYHHELLAGDLGVPNELITYKEGLWSGGGNAGYDVEGCVGGLEISTLVFMMYRVIGDRMEPMPIKVVDTGYGIERWAWLSQGSPSAFHSIYGPLLDKAVSWAGIKLDNGLLSELAKYSYLLDLENKSEERMKMARRIDMDYGELMAILDPVEGIYAALDHTKALAFILSEGVVPSNVKEGYLNRMLLRRGYRMLRRASIEDRLADLVDAQIGFWGDDYPQLLRMRDEILEMVAVEERKYQNTLVRGAGLVQRYLSRRKEVPPDQLIEFYDSHGLTPEDVSDVASEMGIQVRIPGDFYTQVSTRHMDAKPSTEVEEDVDLVGKVEALEKTRRLFYEDTYMREFNGRVVEVIDGRYVVLDQTGFYAEGGGQISDVGKLIGSSGTYDVVNVKSVEGVILHEINGPLPKKGEELHGVIDWDRRMSLMRGHTATHIILGAARRVLGEHAWQAGASKTVERSRLDISHYSRLTREQLESIEELANQVVREGRPVSCMFMQRDQAESKYGFRLYQGGVVPGMEIRIVDMGDWDVEACGGTHLANTSEAGLIKIVGSERIQDGIERLIYAVGPYALKEVQRREAILMEAAEVLRSPFEKVKETIVNNLETMRNLRHELDELKVESSQRLARDLLSKASSLDDGVKLILDAVDKKADLLIEIGNALKRQEDAFVAVLHSGVEPRVVVISSDEAVRLGYDAGKMTHEVSKIIGGGGGGKPHLGQGGGSSLEKFLENRDQIRALIEAQMG